MKNAWNCLLIWSLIPIWAGVIVGVRVLTHYRADKSWVAFAALLVGYLISHCMVCIRGRLCGKDRDNRTDKAD
jgi:hypothetical protein